MTDVTTGKISLDAVLKKIGQPEATWEYSKGEQPVPLSMHAQTLTRRDYDGPPQKKRKTIEPPSTAAEPSAPPSAPAPIPQPQTPYELCRDILQALHRSEYCNARRFQWIIAKFEGRDPGPPPPDTPEPEAEEPAYEELAAKAGQVVEHPERRPEETTTEEVVVERAEEQRAEEPRVEEPTAIAEPRAQTTTQPSSAIIVYQRHHHPPPPSSGASHD
ncbi:uncharacterized protein LOC110265089 [Arachis ipaensis]|uniref:uncharacterized protein LOC110265089 n=1 Tax=Arachis ipaensis TaxID=130454 RepID=UPI000A2B8F8D|nr:uncharacterized protein LOC110265089 [Arachis ipaensis]XP_025664898.1 uncharacterized protein LOC112763447 [Arachis hypogaea]